MADICFADLYVDLIDGLVTIRCLRPNTATFNGCK